MDLFLALWLEINFEVFEELSRPIYGEVNVFRLMSAGMLIDYFFAFRNRALLYQHDFHDLNLFKIQHQFVIHNIHELGRANC